MPINTRESYVEISYGYTPSGIDGQPGTLAEPVLRLPVPTKIPSTDEYLVDASRSAVGSVIIQPVGRTQYKTSVSWLRLKNDVYWSINRYFDLYGKMFYMRYFSHTDGKVKVVRFYRGNMEGANPSEEQEIRDGITVPKYYRNVSYNIIDMGELTTYTESEVVL